MKCLKMIHSYLQNIPFMTCTPCERHRSAFLQEHGEPGLLLADIHCLPGMEGGPVMSNSGKLIGVMSQPLYSQSFHAEASLSSKSGPDNCHVFVLATPCS